MRILIAIFVLGLFWYGANRPAVAADGMSAPKEPIQTQTQKPPFTTGLFTITPLAQYELRARVIKKRRYFFDEGASLAPIDWVLGWGIMSDPAYYEKLEISQDNRWYHFSYGSDFPHPQRIQLHSANTHIIPANDMVAREVFKVRENQTVELKGYLIEAKRDDGYRWVSSLSRSDIKAGSCEIFWVEEIRAY